MKDMTTIEKVEDIGEKIRITATLEKTKLADEFVPYYGLQEDIRRAILPILTEEVLKNKKEIIAKVLKEVNWTEIVRSEVAQKVIRAIASGKDLSNY